MDALLVPQEVPALLGEVRRKGGQEQDQAFQRFAQQRPVLPHRFSRLAVSRNGVDQFHDRADGSVEIEALLVVGGHFFNGAVQGAAQFLLSLAGFRCRPLFFKLLRAFMDQAPDAAQEAVAPLYPLVAPFQVLFRRRRKEDEQPPRIGAVALDNLIGRDDIAL